MQRSIPLAIMALELVLTGCAARTTDATYPGAPVTPTVKSAGWSQVAAETGFIMASAPASPSLPAAPQGPHYVVGNPYQFDGTWYRPEVDYGYSETGTASIYDKGAEGQKTADGEVYQASIPSAAHKTMPLPSMARVTNLDNGRSVEVRVNDRGPFADNQLIQLSRSAGATIGINPGDSVRVRVEIMAAESQALAQSLGASGREQPASLQAVPTPKVTVQPISAELPSLRPETPKLSAQSEAPKVAIGPQYASADASMPPTTFDHSEGAHYLLGAPYQFDGVWYSPGVDYHYDQSGTATIYDPAMKGDTANGEVYDARALTAAHKTLPLPSLVQVTNLDNGRSVEVRVNDRGPFDDSQLIQLSPGAGEALGISPGDSIRVRVQVKAAESQELAAWFAGAAAASHRSLTVPPGTDTASLDQPQHPVAIGTQFASLEGGYVPDTGFGHESDGSATAATSQTEAPEGSDYAPDLNMTRLAATGRPLLLFTLSGSSEQAADASAPAMPTALKLMPPAAPAAGTTPATRIFIQAGAFRQLQNAERMRESLASLGEDVSLVSEPWGNGVVNCVRVGPISSMDDAQQLMDRMAAKGYRDSWLLVE
jgi:rare lipoprotein A